MDPHGGIMQKCETFFCIYMLMDVVLTALTESLPMNLQLHSSGDDPSYYFERFFSLQTHSCSVEPFQIPAAGFLTSIIWAKSQRKEATREQRDSGWIQSAASLLLLIKQSRLSCFIFAILLIVRRSASSFTSSAAAYYFVILCRGCKVFSSTKNNSDCSPFITTRWKDQKLFFLQTWEQPSASCWRLLTVAGAPESAALFVLQVGRSVAPEAVCLLRPFPNFGFNLLLKRCNSLTLIFDWQEGFSVVFQKIFDTQNYLRLLPPSY